jgi:hypothetical protein
LGWIHEDDDCWMHPTSIAEIKRFDVLTAFMISIAIDALIMSISMMKRIGTP